jgi:hypothetical protein
MPFTHPAVLRLHRRVPLIERDQAFHSSESCSPVRPRRPPLPSDTATARQNLLLGAFVRCTARRQAGNQIHAVVDTAPEELRRRFVGRSTAAIVAEVARLHRGGLADTPLQAARFTLRMLGRRWRYLDAEMSELDAQPGPHHRSEEAGAGEPIVSWSDCIEPAPRGPPSALSDTRAR